MSRKYAVGIVGATVIAGQQFVVALQNRPWFTIQRLAASERSAGKPFAQALLDAKTEAGRWWRDEEPAADVLSIPVENGLDRSIPRRKVSLDEISAPYAVSATRPASSGCRRRQMSGSNVRGVLPGASQPARMARPRGIVSVFPRGEADLSIVPADY